MTKHQDWVSRAIHNLWTLQQDFLYMNTYSSYHSIRTVLLSSTWILSVAVYLEEEICNLPSGVPELKPPPLNQTAYWGIETSKGKVFDWSQECYTLNDFKKSLVLISEKPPKVLDPKLNGRGDTLMGTLHLPLARWQLLLWPTSHALLRVSKGVRTSIQQTCERTLKGKNK